MLEVTIIAKIQTLSIENIFYDGDIVRWRMSMRTANLANLARVAHQCTCTRLRTLSIAVQDPRMQTSVDVLIVSGQTAASCSTFSLYTFQTKPMI
jgi:hypothetical protein